MKVLHLQVVQLTNCKDSRLVQSTLAKVFHLFIRRFDLEATTHTSGRRERLEVQPQSFGNVFHEAVDEHHYVILASIRNITTFIAVNPQL